MLIQMLAKSKTYSCRKTSIVTSVQMCNVTSFLTCAACLKTALRALFNKCGGIAQWQSNRLQIDRSMVQIRVPPTIFFISPFFSQIPFFDLKACISNDFPISVVQMAIPCNSFVKIINNNIDIVRRNNSSVIENNS